MTISIPLLRVDTEQASEMTTPNLLALVRDKPVSVMNKVDKAQAVVDVITKVKRHR